MIIRVFSKKNCAKCEAAKEKLTLLGLEYEDHTLEFHVTARNGWRERGDPALVAKMAHKGMDLSKALPTIEIDGEVYDYASAMKHLKKRKS